MEGPKRKLRVTRVLDTVAIRDSLDALEVLLFKEFELPVDHSELVSRYAEYLDEADEFLKSISDYFKKQATRVQFIVPIADYRNRLYDYFRLIPPEDRETIDKSLLKVQRKHFASKFLPCYEADDRPVRVLLPATKTLDFNTYWSYDRELWIQNIRKIDKYFIRSSDEMADNMLSTFYFHELAEDRDSEMMLFIMEVEDIPIAFAIFRRDTRAVYTLLLIVVQRLHCNESNEPQKLGIGQMFMDRCVLFIDELTRLRNYYRSSKEEAPDMFTTLKLDAANTELIYYYYTKYGFILDDADAESKESAHFFQSLNSFKSADKKKVIAKINAYLAKNKKLYGGEAKTWKMIYISRDNWEVFKARMPTHSPIKERLISGGLYFEAYPNKQPIEFMFQCIQCGIGTNLACEDCKSVFYCGSECQRTHWPLHTSRCLGQ
jgi:MYND finger